MRSIREKPLNEALISLIKVRSVLLGEILTCYLTFRSRLSSLKFMIWPTNASENKKIKKFKLNCDS